MKRLSLIYYVGSLSIAYQNGHLLDRSVNLEVHHV